MVTLFAVAYGIVLHLGAGRVLIRKSATRAIETLLPESFSWKNEFLLFSLLLVVLCISIRFLSSPSSDYFHR